ncbi:sensor histidine kinase [Streptomyces cavernicola]|uniref:histidine kinase n=1 Tax=Streptomyces cavernicola TaxID=3043613 RepID=A0ABT6S538_9ACTN|nr:nitrate- and nitrite sensing domain-containing protein [Streptomyces sp. B-S-A6]MDI3403140.1 nitrate- and nitrite sensing domain-containing protein [Streptomyces sp. B-S-A6]
MPVRLPLPERLRPKSIRAKVVTLLTVPVVSLMALWGHAAVTTATQVSDAEQLKQVNSALVQPVSDFTRAVQDERSAALVQYAAPGPAARSAYDAAKSRTDKAAAALRAGVRSSSTDIAGIDAGLPGRIQRLLHSAETLTGREADTGSAALARYSTAVEHGFAVRSALARADGAGAAADTRAVLELARAREALSRQNAVYGAAQADGEMTAEQYRTFVGDVALQRSLTKSAAADLAPRDATAYRAVLDSPAAADLRTAQDDVLEASAGNAVGAVPAGSWHAAAGETLTGLDRAERATAAPAAAAEPYSLATLGSSGLAVLLGLLGVVLALILSVRIGRGLVNDLTGLRNRALDLAATRLPTAMRRIHNGEVVDLDTEAPLARTPIRDEVGQVGAALTTVQRAALRAVAGRAAVLTGVSGVYVSLARRSQVLLHRQLELLDTMERRTENPTDLEDLFRLDHLTTRMRRHAESLLILSGSAPGRAWRNPVPLIDAVRAGIAETADIDRVQLHDVPDLLLAGSAVADLVHLVAELAENAAQFSPPHTPVVVRGEEVGAGAVLEIEDRGLGMGDEALAAANEKIHAPDIDLLDSRQLGLFVVNRLAERQHVDVTLRRSVYGGITAVVFVPKELLEAPHPGLRPLPELPQRRPALQPAPPHPDPNPEPVRPAPQPVRAAPEPVRPEPQPVRAAPEPIRPPLQPQPQPRTQPKPQPLPPEEPAPVEHPAPLDDGLPRRVRQANMAPELREPEAGPEPEPQLPGRRSPEAARATMASLRSGRHRARAAREAAAPPPAPSEGDRVPHATPTDDEGQGPR